MACGDKKARFDTVILDATLTKTLLRPIAAITAIDAVAHAVESFVSTRNNPMSRMFSRHAWELLNANFEACLVESESSVARSKMLFGAYLAGLAIEKFDARCRTRLCQPVDSEIRHHPRRCCCDDVTTRYPI